ncbi:hypothetical protein RHSIM_Rhsim02G0039200 [Rhododendron simsii]|uniref:Cation-transporting P-type ATPase C-terminal domain-containing protein n=1 Tax=Rhododendron simsii TaxID=118357 RepID=A0A834HBS5_RHOSS|nr:hypothetical protein RHSIM_Rhsim02G0039200 [Rhododendron simsii]
MMSDHAMAGKLSACKTMGFATTICTDKTGTLTLNQIKVTKFWLGQEFIEEKGTSTVATSVVELLCHGAGLNATGFVNMFALGSEFGFSGSPTEKAILSWAISELNLDMEGLRQSGEILHVEALNSMKKRSGVLMRNKEQNTINFHIKGGVEMVVAMCPNYYDVSGTIKVLDDDERKIFDGIIQVGLMDPRHPGVKEAVQEFQYAGVNVKMVTGDNIFIARAIATECGILKPNQDMESGAVGLSTRQTPNGTMLEAKRPRGRGHRGWNQRRAALREADIGLSMGIQGTEVAKVCSDILTLTVATLAINFVVSVSTGEVPLSAVELVSANVNDTLILNVLALCQVFNVIFLWKLENKNVFEGIHKNNLFLVIMGVTIAVQVVVVEFLKKVVGTERLNWWQWGVCVGSASVSWPIGWVVKWIPVPQKPFLLHTVKSLRDLPSPAT